MDSGSFVTVVKTGSTITTGASSANASIPTAQSGEVPRYIRVVATVAAYVKLGIAGVTAAAGDLMVQPGDAVLMHVPLGITTIAAIQVSAAGVVQVSPLENM